MSAAPAPVTRYALTQRTADGTGRELASPAQGRHTYATEAEAAAHLAAVMSGTDPATLAQVFRLPLAVEPVPCYPGHFDPMRTRWAAWHLESLDRSPARLIDPSGDCVAMIYLTDANRKRTPASLDRAARIVAALNASL